RSTWTAVSTLDAARRDACPVPGCHGASRSATLPACQWGAGMKDLAYGSTVPTSAALQDDGATAHLPGMRLPSVPLAATNGHIVDLSTLRGRTVVYAYPRTGVPGQSSP